ncbi:metal-dependent hydrolase [Azohydromonas caseinilytica]|uniref:Metal-dependent hydrolase n=1 Tax=Azohydromonas caseinilytica TaxID=2728836 RepID=A0A848F5H2_9BURK|nr:metal-dependent hydrolase [Azohydromonas caseinilytica]NML14378.1 metal-dependent hydrolase [Azohydromonas caseinilytica]
MDSLTHVALGATLGVAVLGRRIAPWKAALWGAVCNTLPDLDVLIDHGDAVSNMVLHRGHSHSLLWLALLAPLLAAPMARWLGGGFKRWWLATTLALLTHPLLDLMTVYGTRLALPFSDHPFAVGSLFIIDPLVTLPLLGGLLAALALRGARGRRWNLLGLALSVGYIAWSVVAQQQVQRLALASARAQGLAPQRVLVTPAPLNTLLWRVVLVQDGHYHEGFRSLLDRGDTMAFERFDRGTALAPLLRPVQAAQHVRSFSHGFYKLAQAGEELLITDLRMGQEPQYVFGFVVARQEADGAVRPVPPRQVGGRIDTGRALAWLWPRMLGRPLPPPR